MSNATTIAVVVDGYSAGNFLPAAFGSRGVEVVHVQTSRDLLTSMSPPNIDLYRENIVLDAGVVDDELLKRLAGLRPLCVVPGQESAVEFADELAERLGLPGNGVELSRARRDKYAMNEALRAAGVPCVEQRKGADETTLADWADATIGYPAVVKPLDSAGTDGVYICANRGELVAGIRAVLAASNIFGSPNHEALVQRYLVGPEYIVDTVTAAGRHYACGVWKYHKQLLSSGRNIYDRDELQPEDSSEVHQLVDYVFAVLDVVGVAWGPGHTEVILTDQGPVLVEVGARLNGNINPAFHDACLGHNQAALLVDAFVDPARLSEHFERRIFQRRQPALVFNGATTLAGEVVGIDDNAVDEIRRLPSVFELNVKYRTGTHIRPTTDLLSSSFRAFLTHRDDAQLSADYLETKKLGDRLYTTTEPDARRV